MTIRKKCLVTVLAVLPQLAVTERAQSATYAVQACRSAAGAVIPVADTSGGWYPMVDGRSRDSINLCGTDDAQLRSNVGGTSPVNVAGTAQWRFAPPRGTSIAAYRIVYTGYARPFDGRNGGVIGVDDSESGVVTTQAGTGAVPTVVVARSGIHAIWVSGYARCDGPLGNPPCDPMIQHAHIALRELRVVLDDPQPPTSEAPRGSAVSESLWSGRLSLSAGSSDVGGGLASWSIDVDGSRVSTRPLPGSSAPCADPSGTHLYTSPTPCPPSADLVLPIDADALPPGAHDVTVRIADAAGNERTVFSARRTIVPSARSIGPGSDLAMRGAANGLNAADAARLAARWTTSRHTTLSIPYGQRPVLRGRLANAFGAPIRGARVELLARLAGRAGAPLDKGGARTRPDGSFSMILPRNLTSRDLELRYRARANDTVPSAWRTLRLRVRAGITLHAGPRSVTKGRATTLRGRLTGRPLPAGGKVLELQARNPGGRWLTFRTVRTTAGGRFSARYRFRRPGPATFEMRVRSRASADYPYATGMSPIARVHVR